MATSASPVDAVLASIEQTRPWQEDLYRHVHEHPETDPDTFHEAEAQDRVNELIPVNHSPHFAPVNQPTLDTGTQAMVVAALAWLTDHG